MTQPLLRFVHLSDTHYAPPDYDPSPARLHPRRATEKLIEHVNSLTIPPDFILHTGDVIYDPHPYLYEEVKTLFAQFRAPVISVPGNHDHSAGLQKTLMARDAVQVPLWRSQVVNGVRLILLDTNHADVKPPAGRVSDEQLDWLRAQLAADDDRPIVVGVHHPLLKTHTSEWYDVFMGTENGDDVHAILKTAAARIRGVFFGHVHQNLTFIRDGITYNSVRSSWTQFEIVPGQDMETRHDLPADPGYNIVTLTETGAYVQHIVYRVDA